MLNPYETRTHQNYSNIKLTPEEERILRECSKEATFQRGVPLGLMSGMGAFYLTKIGYIKHRTFGAIPAVIFSSLFGFLVGRFSFSRVCLQRAMNVPDGTLRKLFLEANQQNNPRIDDTPDPVYYPPAYNATHQPARNINNDTAHTTVGSFDVAPVASDDYYSNHPTNPVEELPVETYTKSYDELRQANRKQYVDTYYSRNPSRTQAPPPRQAPARKEEPQMGLGQEKTKYGDVWG